MPHAGSTTNIGKRHPGGQPMLSSICSKSHYFWSKTNPKKKDRIPLFCVKYYYIFFSNDTKKWYKIGCKRANFFWGISDLVKFHSIPLFWSFSET